MNVPCFPVATGLSVGDTETESDCVTARVTVPELAVVPFESVTLQ